ncbi:nitrate- and nitrite sensing domain-containing protein [Streptomyces sp. NA02950]|uniref:nitrate- and nitrite sensing domain-containing protein n=1 Tax=Streptomyces sp. NA02950 TaxID=2742137 RepID=UPI0015929F3C|nr:nitrate- and nitrite sensing domain-containing protein [Streptomyces sp. NA02950]QKV92375.1 nitrate- and nitrite sensing domain-containing protein [Streptomyces sp. NA02950]
MRRSKADSVQEARGNFTPPPRTRTAASPADAPDPPAGSGGRFSPRNWRVRTRLYAILLIPVLVALVFGGFQVAASVKTWSEAQDAERTARVVRAAATYGQAIIDERDRTAGPLLSGTNADVVRKARSATDQAREEFDEAVKDMPQTATLKRRLAAFRSAEPQLTALRRNAYTDRLDGVKTEEGYVAVQHALTEFANELGLGTGNITSYGRTVYAVSLAKGAESLQRSIGTHLLVKPGPSAAERKVQLTAFGSYVYLEGIALGEFTSAGMPEDVSKLEDTMAAADKRGKAQLAEAKRKAEAAGQKFTTPPSMKRMLTAIGSGASPQELKARGITPDVWFNTATGKFDAYREVEQSLVNKAVNEAAQISSDAKRDAIVNSAIVVLALLAAFVVAARMARSMSRSMQQLRNAAFDVAEQRLPMLVDQLSRNDPGRVDTRVAPIPLNSQDEMGEVARAFDQVHREAIRLAAEQAMLRGNVNAIFTNLSSRNQGLIERQLTLISELESREADPDQLEHLFRLDHLATRMRRNGENLLILAGEEPGRRWNQPVALIDVLRAASSEVESYERIELAGISEGDIHGTAVTDLVHLLAELLENATTFSSPHTKVRVTATRLPDGRVMVEIHDKGIGLTPEDFADINHKLANPPTVDAAVSQRMGLFVVGRLADRHGIRVQLRPSGEQAGTTSLVMLPEAITHGGGGEELPPDDFTVSRIVPEQQHSYQDQPAVTQRTAAELGFDDSPYPQYQGQYSGMQAAPHEQEPRRDPTPAEPAQPSYEAPSYAEPEPHYRSQSETGQQPYVGYNSPSQQGEWGDSGSFEMPYASQFGTQTESGPSAPEVSGERVEFHRPGPAPSDSRSRTDAWLPRRDKQWQPSGDPGAQGVAGEPPAPAAPERPQQAPRQVDTGQDQWQSANDQRWRRAEQLREPKAGGVTSSGLPRRVPKANLVEGAAEQSGQGGPQVSRAPEDVRGRLSNLRRGVQRGRTAGSGIPGRDQHDQQGYGPGSTYDQER